MKTAMNIVEKNRCRAIQIRINVVPVFIHLSSMFHNYWFPNGMIRFEIRIISLTYHTWLDAWPKRLFALDAARASLVVKVVAVATTATTKETIGSFDPSSWNQRITSSFHFNWFDFHHVCCNRTPVSKKIRQKGREREKSRKDRIARSNKRRLYSAAPNPNSRLVFAFVLLISV